MRKLKPNSATGIFVSFDIHSLFPNVPLNESINICAHILYRGPVMATSFLESAFVELRGIATKSVSFSFHNYLYKQIDGVAMDSPLSPSLANISVGFHEKQKFNKIDKPYCYFRIWMKPLRFFSSLSKAGEFFLSP